MKSQKPTSRSDMYEWIDRRWNPVKGECGFGCEYCYTKRWGKQRPIHLDEQELRVDLGSDNFIFVCSGCDLFHPAISDFWIAQICVHARDFPYNRYLFHTKNPARILELTDRGFSWPPGTVFCVTAESDIKYPQMGSAPDPAFRLMDLSKIKNSRMVTIEPVMTMQFIPYFSELILKCEPEQVNIGADSGRNKLTEPTREELEELIEQLAPHTKVKLKKNLRRLLPEHRLYGGENG